MPSAGEPAEPPMTGGFDVQRLNSTVDGESHFDLYNVAMNLKNYAPPAEALPKAENKIIYLMKL
jgi:hypothetical protein